MFPEGRLFDILIVGAVALMVVGPKDLPVLMRKVGRFMAKVRGMAAEFRASFDELARQSELDELRREVQALRGARPLDYAASRLGAHDVMSDIRADLAETKAALSAPPEASAAPPAAPPDAPLAPAAQASAGGSPPSEPEPPAAAETAAPKAAAP